MKHEETPVPTDGLAWAKKLADDGSWVMHLPTQTIGKVARLYDGEGNVYVAPTNGREVRAPVLELEPGHTFVAEPSAFIVLSEREHDFHTRAAAVVKKLVQDCAMLSTAAGVQRPTAMLLLAVIFRQVASELDKARQKA